MASPNSAGQRKHNLRNYADGLRIVPPTPPLSAQQVHPKISPFEDLIMVSTPLAESSSTRNHLPYHIFINHYGPDTKHSLANNIYKKLNDKGLRVFLDQADLQLGDFLTEGMKNGISSASIQIAIFSKNYAGSPWCLNELAFMLSLPTQVTLIPIFYHVEPSTLRWAIEGKGMYADAFNEYEKKGRYTPKLQSWKTALHKASLYTGQIINNQLDEEAAVINVVNHILKELRKKVTFSISRPVVGLDELEQDFHKKIYPQFDFGPIKIVGIWGMGGAGKTTLAKYLYDKKFSSFKKSSFLFDVSEAARNECLHDKQIELLNDFNKQKELLNDLDQQKELFNVKDVNQGKEILRNRLRSVSGLIVLDDVDHTNQLDALLPERDNLGHESLIIVTTRDLHVLRAWGISAIYKIPTLNPLYAQQLFCWHTFGQPTPLEEFKELAQKFVDACDGLPLSLVVLGSLLRGEFSQTYWQSQLDTLSTLKRFEDIKLKLKTSYDALDIEHKELFLDVACFFNGYECSKAIATWDGIGQNGLCGLQMLVDKSFVEIDDKGDIKRIKMHFHLRDLGRDIALQETPYRLWSKDQIIQIQSQQKAIPIRGMADAFGDDCYLDRGNIVLKRTQGEPILAPAPLGLKIFIGQGSFINEKCTELSRELVFFSCVRFVHKNLSSWLSLKKLRVLELYEPQELEDLWERVEDAPSQLRQLRIHKGYELKKLSQLQRLRFLEEVIIHDCTELNTLPSLAEATSLKKIDLSRCYKLEKIESLESLTSLETLIIYFCTELNTLPSLAGATSLKKFDLRRCYKLDKIESLEGLTLLETLRIYDCTELNTLPTLAELTSLKKFDLRRCNKLEKIESLQVLTSLETLIIHDCTELNTLPSLAKVTSLKIFDLSRCYKLEQMESLEGLRSLETLIIYYCTRLKTLPSIAEATSLKKFDLRHCKNLEKIESLAGLRSLETLTVNNCTKLESLPSYEKSTSLKVSLKGCNKLDQPFTDH